MQITYRDHTTGELVTIGEPSKPRKKKSASEETDKKAWLVYRPGKGYFWGPGHPNDGESAHFGIDGR